MIAKNSVRRSQIEKQEKKWDSESKKCTEQGTELEKKLESLKVDMKQVDSEVEEARHSLSQIEDEKNSMEKDLSLYGGKHEEFREKIYEAVREIHITRFPYNKFLYPDYKDAVEKEEKE